MQPDTVVLGGFQRLNQLIAGEDCIVMQDQTKRASLSRSHGDQRAQPARSALLVQCPHHIAAPQIAV